MNSLITALKADKEVQKYIELRSIIQKNGTYLEALNCKLSGNKAKICSLEVEKLIDEYLEYEALVKEKLDFIKQIIENELNF